MRFEGSKTCGAKGAFIALLGAALLALAGCGTNWKPAPSANALPGKGAVTAADGVRMVARADAWDARPAQLEEQVTPMLVTITNTGTEPIRVAYNKFRLVSATGRRYSALPPFSIEGEVSAAAVGAPFYPATGFGYAPYLTPYFGAGLPYYTGFAANPLYWDAYGPVMRTVELPTLDMLQRALPEGMLEPGGSVTGFVYFEGVGPDVERVELRADFPKPLGQRTEVTRLVIPFVVA